MDLARARRADLAALREPSVALYCLYAASVPLARPGVFAVAGNPVQLADVLLILSYAAWGVLWVRRRPRLVVDGALVASLVFLATLGLSLAASGGLRTGALLKLGAYATMILSPVLAAQVVTTSAGLRCLLTAWIVGVCLAVVTGVAGIVSFYLDRAGLGAALMCGYGALSAANLPRLCAPFRHPNMLANFLALGGPPVMLLIARTARPVLAWIFAGALLLVGVLTLSTGFAGLVLGVAIVAWGLARGRRWAVPARVTIVAATAAVMAVLTIGTIATLVPPGEGHVSLGRRDLRLWDGPRPSIWRGAAATIVRHPLTGAGYGTLVAETSDPRRSRQSR